jgi:hypothetical protein
MTEAQRKRYFELGGNLGYDAMLGGGRAPAEGDPPQWVFRVPAENAVAMGQLIMGEVVTDRVSNRAVVRMPMEHPTQPGLYPRGLTIVAEGRARGLLVAAITVLYREAGYAATLDVELTADKAEPFGPIVERSWRDRAIDDPML